MNFLLFDQILSIFPIPLTYISIFLFNLISNMEYFSGIILYPLCSYIFDYAFYFSAKLCKVLNKRPTEWYIDRSVFKILARNTRSRYIYIIYIRVWSEINNSSSIIMVTSKLTHEKRHTQRRLQFLLYISSNECRDEACVCIFYISLVALDCVR